MVSHHIYSLLFKIKFVILFLFFSVIVLTSCTTSNSFRRTRKKSPKIKKATLKINGENISSNGVEIIREDSNRIIESKVDINKYETSNEGITEQINNNYTETDNQNDTLGNRHTSTTIKRENLRTTTKISKIQQTDHSTSKQIKKNSKTSPLKAESELKETFTIAKSEMVKTPFALANENRFSNLNNETDSSTDIILKQVKTLYLLGNNREALEILKNNWESFITSEKENDTPEKSPLAEAFFLKGKINLNLANKTADLDLAQQRYKIAIKSFYIVLSKYNARRCPFSSESIKLFSKCRKKYFKLYKVKVGFPPEFPK